MFRFLLLVASVKPTTQRKKSTSACSTLTSLRLLVISRPLALSDDICESLCAFAAVDTRHTGNHAIACDGEERKKEDYDNLVNTALRKAGSKKALLPTKSKKHFKETDLRNLTLSKRKFVVEQALEVIHCSSRPALPTPNCMGGTPQLPVQLQADLEHLALSAFALSLASLRSRHTLLILLSARVCSDFHFPCRSRAERGCGCFHFFWQAQEPI